jgi:ribosome-binding factor A
MINKTRKKIRTINEEKNIEEAEILIAAEGVNNLLQEILEDLNDWKIKKFYTLVDRIRKIFGVNIAEKYMTAIDETLNSTLNNLEDLKQKFSYVNLELEKLVSGESTKFDIDFKNENKIDDENFIKKISNANKNSENKGDIEMQKKLSEKWGVDFEVEKGEKGKWTPYSVEELCRKWKELREKKNKTEKDLETIRELAFAIRAKYYGGHEKWGSAKKVCSMEKKRDETKSLAAGKYDYVDHSHRGPKKEPGKKPVREKWGVDFEVEKGEKGKWTPYSVEELCRKWKELREKKNKTEKDLETIRELAFAIRAKYYGGHEKWGSAKKVCGIEESYDETKSSSAGKYRVDHSHRGPKRKLGKKLMNENRAVIDFDEEKEAGEIGDADWILLYGNKEDLESILQHFDVPASEYDDISGALVSPDYKELWVSFSSKPYLVNAKYYKVKTL